MIARLFPPEQRPRRLKRSLTLATVALVAVTVHASTTHTDHYGQDASPDARRDVMDQASALASQVMSYRAATADKDIAAAKQLMTEEMQSAYDRTLPPPADRRRQLTSGVRVRALVARVDGGDVRRRCPRAACAVGVTSLTSDKATVLLFVNQYATASSTKNTVINPTWEVMRLVKRDGEWIIAGMEAP